MGKEQFYYNLTIKIEIVFYMRVIKGLSQFYNWEEHFKPINMKVI